MKTFPTTLFYALVPVVLTACPPPPEPTSPAVSPSPSAATISSAQNTHHPTWQPLFATHGAIGTAVVVDTTTGQRHVHDPDRAAERFVPAATFKIYNSLVALETGAAGGVDEVFAWDGVERGRPELNRGHSIRTGIADSVVWLYQELARRIGRAGYEGAVAREPYGNGEIGDEVTVFWLDGPLAISAEEQVAYLERLRRGELAFRPEVQGAVREVLLLEEGRTLDGESFRLYGKTGWLRPSWSTPPEEDLGWMVGWIEVGDFEGIEPGAPPGEQPAGNRAWVYALNLEADEEVAGAPGAPELDIWRARRAVLDGVLADLGLRPLQDP